MEELTPVRCGCGGEAQVETDHDTIQPVAPIDWKRVVCTKCNIRTTWRKTETEAIEAWNKSMGSAEKSSTVERTAKVKEDEWTEHKMLSRDYGKIYYQHDCSCNLYESPYPFCPNCGMKMKRGDR